MRSLSSVSSLVLGQDLGHDVVDADLDRQGAERGQAGVSGTDAADAWTVADRYL
ncbi:MAG: hypothetical protein AB7W59_22575 [Acidimicrobiia bacterium]